MAGIGALVFLFPREPVWCRRALAVLVQIAQALGAKPIGVAAKTTPVSMRINYFIREAFDAAYMRVAGVLC